MTETVKSLGKSIFKLKNLVPLLSLAYGSTVSLATGTVTPVIPSVLEQIEKIVDNFGRQSSDSKIIEDIRKDFSEILNKLKKM